jgi:hypothetical protein
VVVDVAAGAAGAAGAGAAVDGVEAAVEVEFVVTGDNVPAGVSVPVEVVDVVAGVCWAAEVR